MKIHIFILPLKCSLRVLESDIGELELLNQYLEMQQCNPNQIRCQQ